MRVLAVDDDELVRDLVALKLGQAGFDVTTAGDGQEGLELALDGRFDLILLDVMMPRLSGVEVCRRLRDEPAMARTPIVLLTLRSREVDVEHGFAAGADDYIVKPFSPRELLSRCLSLTAGGERAGTSSPAGVPAPGGATSPAAADPTAAPAAAPGAGADELHRVVAALAAATAADHAEAMRAVADLRRSVDELAAALRGAPRAGGRRHRRDRV